MQRHALAAVVALAFVACGDNRAAPPAPDAAPDAGVDAPPAVLDAASFCHDFSARVCAGLSSCGCRFDVRAYDAAGCVDARTAACVASFGAKVTPDVEAGRAHFDAAAVTACLAAMTDLADRCVLDRTSLSAPLPDACNAIVLSSAAVGEECQLAGGGLAFCGAGDAVCAPGASGTTCTALPGSGADCLSGLCAPGLACNGTTCGAPVAAGEACDSPTACQHGLVCDATHHCGALAAADAACETSLQCQRGLACDQGTCKVLAALGDGCRNPDACGAERSCGRAPETRTCADPDGLGAACTDTTCATTATCSSSTRTCVALPGDGEPCLDGFACADGLTCLDGVGTCAPLPGLGATCATGNRFCAAGLGCRQSDNTCQAGPGLGQECLLNPPDYVCGAGLGCDFGMNGSTCIAIGGAGAACTNDRTCGTGTFCNFGTLVCTARYADGQACKDGNECRPGSECEPLPGGPVCAPIPMRGTPCFDACTTGLACKGPGGECVPELCTIP